MHDQEAAPSRRLIAAVLTQAIYDALLVKRPRPAYYRNHRKSNHLECIAYNARLFINSQNKLFCFYCFMADVCPKRLERKAHAYFREYDQGTHIY